MSKKKEIKEATICVRLSERQSEYVEELKVKLNLKSKSAAIQYLLNEHQIKSI
ncbi:hypothetical protein SC206_18965 [Rouxiella sp. T17]|uniref:hypothetical protein n=1 Tax=Rouxiella sp. T17 TaxID=3085684 RepID=UPI002FCBFA9A